MTARLRWLISEVLRSLAVTGAALHGGDVAIATVASCGGPGDVRGEAARGIAAIEAYLASGAGRNSPPSTSD